jgi:hypothetical protein
VPTYFCKNISGGGALSSFACESTYNAANKFIGVFFGAVSMTHDYAPIIFYSPIVNITHHHPN